jgi:hypothetical protein
MQRNSSRNLPPRTTTVLLTSGAKFMIQFQRGKSQRVLWTVHRLHIHSVNFSRQSSRERLASNFAGQTNNSNSIKRPYATS